MSGVTHIIAVEGLDALKYLEKIPADVERAAVRALNKATPRARTAISKGIRADVNLTATYLNTGDRLTVAKRARKGDLEGIVRGRTRPTSLARFTKDKPLAPGQVRRKKGIKLEVSPGVATYKSTAFVIPLRSGSDGALGNLGLAVRSETQPAKTYKPKLIGKNLWLLYGPSVSQVMYSVRNQGGVANDVAPDTAAFLEAEFLRLLNLDLK